MNALIPIIALFPHLVIVVIALIKKSNAPDHRLSRLWWSAMFASIVCGAPIAIYSYLIWGVVDPQIAIAELNILVISVVGWGLLFPAFLGLSYLWR